MGKSRSRKLFKPLPRLLRGGFAKFDNRGKAYAFEMARYEVRISRERLQLWRIALCSMVAGPAALLVFGHLLTIWGAK